MKFIHLPDIQETILSYIDSPQLKEYAKKKGFIINKDIYLLEQRYMSIYKECAQAVLDSYDNLNELISRISDSVLLRNNVALAVMTFFSKPKTTESSVELVASLLQEAGTPIVDKGVTPMFIEDKAVSEITDALLIMSLAFPVLEKAKMFKTLISIALNYGNIYKGITVGYGEVTLKLDGSEQNTVEISMSKDNEIVACAIRLGYPYNEYASVEGALNYIKSIVPQIKYIDDKVILRLGILVSKYDADRDTDVLAYMAEGYDKLLEEEKRQTEEDELYNIMLNYFKRRIPAVEFNKDKRKAIINYCKKGGRY